MRYLDAEQSGRLLDYPGLIEGLRRLHREAPGTLDDLLLAQDSNRFFLRAAWQPDQALGAKVITIFPDNPQRCDRPSIQALYLLFDGRDGRPLLAIDGTLLTWRKTAADSALGADFLACEDARTLLMVGAGAMAPELIRAHRAVRPSLSRVRIWNQTPERARTLAERLTEVDGLDAVAVEALEPAVTEADLICCATMSREPLIRGDWLRPGQHLDLVGAYTPDMREADDVALQRGMLFVDSRQTAGETGELAIPRAAGVIDEQTVRADLFQLCQGRHPGRSTAGQITLFKNGGGGHLDLMTARILQQRLTTDA